MNNKDHLVGQLTTVTLALTRTQMFKCSNISAAQIDIYIKLRCSNCNMIACVDNWEVQGGANTETESIETCFSKHKKVRPKKKGTLTFQFIGHRSDAN